MLNIGDFARFAGVTVRMLRHYDALGLLVRTVVDPHNGYRRYDESLLARAHQLVALKELGLYTVIVHLGHEVEAELKVWVVPTAGDEQPGQQQPQQPAPQK